jgi:hypothetical protein
MPPVDLIQAPWISPLERKKIINLLLSGQYKRALKEPLVIHDLGSPRAETQRIVPAQACVHDD